jgi:hypothetical protein
VDHVGLFNDKPGYREGVSQHVPPRLRISSTVRHMAAWYLRIFVSEEGHVVSPLHEATYKHMYDPLNATI